MSSIRDWKSETFKSKTVEVRDRRVEGKIKSLLLCQVVWLEGRIWQKTKGWSCIGYFFKINYYLYLKFKILENSKFNYLTIILTIFISAIAILHYVTWRPQFCLDIGTGVYINAKSLPSKFYPI